MILLKESFEKFDAELTARNFKGAQINEEVYQYIYEAENLKMYIALVLGKEHPKTRVREVQDIALSLNGSQFPISCDNLRDLLERIKINMQ